MWGPTPPTCRGLLDFWTSGPARETESQAAPGPGSPQQEHQGDQPRAPAGVPPGRSSAVPLLSYQGLSVGSVDDAWLTPQRISACTSTQCNEPQEPRRLLRDRGLSRQWGRRPCVRGGL